MNNAWASMLSNNLFSTEVPKVSYKFDSTIHIMGDGEHADTSKRRKRTYNPDKNSQNLKYYKGSSYTLYDGTDEAIKEKIYNVFNYYKKTNPLRLQDLLREHSMCSASGLSDKQRAGIKTRRVSMWLSEYDKVCSKIKEYKDKGCIKDATGRFVIVKRMQHNKYAYVVTRYERVAVHDIRNTYIATYEDRKTAELALDIASKTYNNNKSLYEEKMKLYKSMPRKVPKGDVWLTMDSYIPDVEIPLIDQGMRFHIYKHRGKFTIMKHTKNPYKAQYVARFSQLITAEKALKFINDLYINNRQLYEDKLVLRKTLRKMSDKEKVWLPEGVESSYVEKKPKLNTKFQLKWV